jgi:hypothetical protein
MIKIILPAYDLEQAIEIRDRIRGIVLRDSERVTITDGGVQISTNDPVRVCKELQSDGFF